jgi:hypothetical protein
MHIDELPSPADATYEWNMSTGTGFVKSLALRGFLYDHTIFVGEIGPN